MIFIFTEDDLRELHPTSTQAERQRFFRSFYSSTERDQDTIHGEGKDMLGEYLDFRQRYKLDAPDNILAKQRGNDRSDWHYASTLACKMGRRHGQSKQGHTLRQMLRSNHKIGATKIGSNSLDELEHATTPPPLTQYIFTRKATKADCSHAKTNVTQGQLVLEIRLDQMKLQQAPLKTHELAVALYIDRKFDRTDLGQAMVFIDGRHCSTLSMVVPKLSAVKSLLRHMKDLYPGRFQEIITYHCRPQVTSAGVYTTVIRGLSSSSLSNFWGKVGV